MMLRIILCLALTMSQAACADSRSEPDTAGFAPGSTIDFSFKSGGNQLSGVFDVPDQEPARALILFVHGYGETDVRGWNMYAELRERFTQMGIATATWDKPGQGQSEGAFDINQDVHDSAREVVDAARELREIGAPGSDYIGVWGVSRAGWIVPIALSADKRGDVRFEFWISVSGVSAEDNFTYLVLSNLPHEGGSVAEAEALSEEWRAGCAVFRSGGSYESYQEATQTLRANEYVKRMRGDWPSWVEYKFQQRSCDAGSCAKLDDEMCSYVHIEEFEMLLSSLDVDVLALFGEKDLNVDWRKTRALYERSIGQNPSASIEIKSFEDADHNLNVSETGSLKEMQAMRSARKVEGYFDVQVEWLRRRVISRQ